jgi:hypothetical protein
MFEFNINKDMKKEYNKGSGTYMSVAAHICLTLFVKELKINVEQGRVVTSLNIIKH